MRSGLPDLACRARAICAAGIVSSVFRPMTVWARDWGALTLDSWLQVRDLAAVAGFLALGALVVVFLNSRRSLRLEIARRERIEAETEEERSRLNAILNKAGVGVQLVDRNLRLIDVNHRWCQMFGHRRRDVRGQMRSGASIHADDARAMEKHFAELLTGRGARRTQECRFQRKDGSVFWGLVSTSTVETRAGERMWVVAMITDIDAQKKAEQSLRESEERLRFITESTHDAVWQLDGDHRFTYISSADERMRGIPRDAVVGQPFDSQILPSGRGAFEQTVAKCAGDGGTIHLEVEMTCADATTIWAEINSTPIRDASGRITGFIGVTRDATERRARQLELREQAIRDPLSGLFNRRYLAESLPRELARARRDNLLLSILMIDIDRFKQLNDTYGHLAGDEVIRQLARLIQSGARGGDLPCRYGGEEFLIVFPDMAIESALERAEQWRQAFQAMVVGDRQISATFSAGVVAFPAHGDTAETLIQAVDNALYAAKNKGRNCVVAGMAGVAARQ
ncbi:MAG: diguanylate cyclase [Propionivibrio sp.]